MEGDSVDNVHTSNHVRVRISKQLMVTETYFFLTGSVLSTAFGWSD
jgi:hypothetical protein